MPHIVKYSERMRCIKPNITTLWEEDLTYKYIKPIQEAYV